MPNFPNLYNLSQVLHRPDLYHQFEQEEFEYLQKFEKVQIGITQLFHKKDEFDSRVFETSVGKAEYLVGDDKNDIHKVVKQFFSKNPYNYIVFRCSQVSTAWIQELEKNGAIFLDSTVDLILELRNKKNNQTSAQLEEATLEDLDQLAEIASSFRYGRFFTDPEYQFGKKIYEQWIENCVMKKASNQVYVYKAGTKIHGFIAIKMETLADLKVMKIVLVGKHSESKESGVATEMLQFLKRKAKQENYDFLSISTQGANIPALRSYIQSGFLPYSTGVTMRWMRNF